MVAENGSPVSLMPWLRSSLLVTPTPDGAEGRAYGVMLNVSSAVPTEVASGHYDDIFVKASDEWHIKVRTGYSDPRLAVTQ